MRAISSASLTRLLGAALLALALALALAGTARAEPGFVPNFWDPNHRVERPDVNIRVIRFISDDDYPPFHFLSPDGVLTGFNIDLARALCDELRVTCTMQPRRWDTIIPTIEKGEADAAIASLAITPAMRQRVEFTQPYMRTPARFLARKGITSDPLPETISGKKIGVQKGTAHEAYLRAFFGKAELRLFESQVALRAALKASEIDLAFGDGISFAVWLNGLDAKDCCAFAGGFHGESKWFGDGVGIAVRRDNAALRRLLDWGLQRLADRGLYAELYLKYFPVGFY